VTQPLAYLARYVLATSLLFSAWSFMGPLYLELVTPAVNALAALTDQPFAMEWKADHLLYRFRPSTGADFRLEAIDHGAVYLNLVTVLALLTATPGTHLRWHFRWVATACVLLWTTHVLSFFLGGPVALWQFSATGPAAAGLVAPLSTAIPSEQAAWLYDVLEIWGIWGRYGLCLGIWWLAALRPKPTPAPARSSVFSVPFRWAMRSTTG